MINLHNITIRSTLYKYELVDEYGKIVALLGSLDSVSKFTGVPLNQLIIISAYDGRLIRGSTQR